MRRFFFPGERAGLTKRPSRLTGFRALLAGGTLLTVLTLILQPATEVRGCSNYGGNGNGTAFADEGWDLTYHVLLLVWLLTVITEQLLPITWNGRMAGPVIARGVLAVTLTLIACCGIGLKLLILCH
ncbi:hypothetical protein ACWT_4074 [Actinoplanes sp. SE50]|uniref:hypothetical protein n=1 Tax=unclassified Actinoplanes TaxID=2626549 RepID=UPI00023EBD64|nr:MULTISPECIES: hypothetical protein [unclassified Actinoplanes]AEV85098.1 hypothetical protein ACPL_4203 [Actinoplanes sp. SE50/110]ATO83489.1 hypothetical protein ACWT_4074 [Actinoplanes sp. SE50]SLM00896.1 hypothetical protein ACSP50_4129 [Actinoplanes sp. SE50/110]